MGAEYLGVLWNDRDAAQADDFKESFTVGHLVRVTKPGEAQLVALSCPDLPKMYDFYNPTGTGTETDVTVLVKSRSARQHENHKQLWAVTINYSSDCKDSQYQAKLPTDRRYRIRHSFERFQKALDSDIDGNPIRNSAGDPYDPPPQIEGYRLVVEVEKNLRSYDAAVLMRYLGAVNSDNFLDFEPGECLVHDISCPGEDYDHGVSFWPTKLVIHVEPWDADVPAARGEHPHRLALLDAGTRTYAGGVWSQVRDTATGRPTNQAVPLDGAGGQAAFGAFAYNVFQVREELPFADLAGLFLT